MEVKRGESKTTLFGWGSEFSLLFRVAVTHNLMIDLGIGDQPNKIDPDLLEKIQEARGRAQPHLQTKDTVEVTHDQAEALATAAEEVATRLGELMTQLTSLLETSEPGSGQPDLASLRADLQPALPTADPE